jgi:hypothetical protein
MTVNKKHGDLTESVNVEDYFVTDKMMDSIDSSVRELEAFTGSVGQICNVFVSNLLSASLTAGAFYVFAKRMAYTVQYNALLGVETGIAQMTKTLFKYESGTATERLEKSLKETDWAKKLNESAPINAAGYLGAFLESSIGRDIACRVVEQCLVLTWSAFEAFLSDVFVMIVNAKPTIAGKLLKEDQTKSLYRGKEIVFLLEQYDYDLSRRMGSVLIEQTKLDDIATIKSIYRAMFGSCDAVEKLNDPRLWKLYKLRNIIVHRAGVVDELFRRDTGSAVPVGERIRVKPADLDQYMRLVADLGLSVGRAAEKACN